MVSDRQAPAVEQPEPLARQLVRVCLRRGFSGVVLDLEELPEAERRLANCAAEACSKSYAPYSEFRVGAAALLDDGEIVSAANQESEVFPSGMCAERSLLYYVQSNRSGRKVRALAIASLPASRECSPCGACRQVIADTEKRQGAPIRLILCGACSATVVESARALLPFTFKLE